jgi:hypothetical protein
MKLTDAPPSTQSIKTPDLRVIERVQAPGETPQSGGASYAHRQNAHPPRCTLRQMPDGVSWLKSRGDATLSV